MARCQNGNGPDLKSEASFGGEWVRLLLSPQKKFSRNLDFSARRNYWKEHILKNIPTTKETFGITRDYMGH